MASSEQARRVTGGGRGGGSQESRRIVSNIRWGQAAISPMPDVDETLFTSEISKLEGLYAGDLLYFSPTTLLKLFSEGTLLLPLGKKTLQAGP